MISSQSCALCETGKGRRKDQSQKSFVIELVNWEKETLTWSVHCQEAQIIVGIYHLVLAAGFSETWGKGQSFKTWKGRSLIRRRGDGSYAVCAQSWRSSEDPACGGFRPEGAACSKKQQSRAASPASSFFLTSLGAALKEKTCYSVLWILVFGATPCFSWLFAQGMLARPMPYQQYSFALAEMGVRTWSLKGCLSQSEGAGAGPWRKSWGALWGEHGKPLREKRWRQKTPELVFQSLPLPVAIGSLWCTFLSTWNTYFDFLTVQWIIVFVLIMKIKHSKQFEIMP